MVNLNLEINDFGIINHANIEINKITIVGGVNDSGKSTACRLLYCFLKSNFLSQKEAVMSLLVDEFNTIFTNPPMDFTVDDDFEYMISEYEKEKEEFKRNQNEKLKTQNVDSLINLLNLMESNKTKLSNLIGSRKNISSVVNQELIYREGLIQFQGNSRLYSSSFESNVEIYRHSKFKDTVNANFIMNLCKCKSNGEIKNSPNVYYIDSFSILNIFNYENSDLLNKTGLNFLGLVNHIDSIINDLYELGNIGPIMWDPIYSNVINKISELIPGRFQPTFFTNDFSFEKDGVFIPTYNTSSGIKQLGIIELLIKKEKLKPGSFLIIDEPEVNLHPDWQFKFAEILVLLAKEADIKIYINSHSPMFIEAMDAFIEYYDMENDVNYYLTSKSNENESKYDFNKINSNELYKIYENLGNGYKLINELRLRKRLSG